MGNYRVGDTVLIHGAGAIGNMNMQLARIRGATTVIVSDPIEMRRQKALECGADYAINPLTHDVYEEVRSISPEGADVIVECAGKTRLIETSVENVRRGGTVVAFGICPPDEYARINPNYMNDYEITLRGSYNNPYTHLDSIRAIASKRINVKTLISHHFSLDQYVDAFSTFGSPDSLKIIINP